MAGQQYEFDNDDIGNVLAAGTGGDQSGLNLRWASNTFNTVNQLTARTTPGYVESYGTAHSNATVTVNLQPTQRHGEYYRAELAVNNSTALWQAVTNIGVLNNGSNPDIVTTNLSYLFVPAASTSLLYDPDGNLTNDGHFSYTWNSENQLTLVASLTNTPAESKRKLTFEYDALGRRIRAGVSRWTNSTWLVTSSNKFLYDGWQLVAELNATNNALVRSYAWGLDLSGSMDDEGGGVGGLLWVNDASTLGSNSTHCVAYDGNGNVTALVDAGSGNETARYEYGPFGDLTQASGLMARANPIRFSSKYHDDATGLIYYGYRYYSPTFQRWLNRDPLGEEGGLNLYGFVNNDPVNGFDPLGQWAYFQPSTWFDGRGYNPGDVENFNGQLAQSILDGIIPFADPFGDNGGYDKCDRLLAIGRHLGEFSRNAYLMRVNFGLGEWAAAGTGLGRSAVGLGVNGVNLGLSAQSIGTGAGKLSAGDGWGAVDLGLGLLGVKPSISGVMSSGSRLSRQLSGAGGFGKSVNKFSYGGDELFTSGVRQQKALAVVREAAQASGVKLGNYVDDVVFTSGKTPFFDVINGRRTIALGQSSLRKTTAGQLVDAVHELNHARHAAKLGINNYKQMYFASQQNYARIEILVESRALNIVERYLRTVSGSTRAASTKYVAGYQKDLP